MSVGLQSLYKPKKLDYLDTKQLDTRGPATMASTQAASDMQTQPPAQVMSPIARQTAAMNQLSERFRAGTEQMRSGALGRTPDPQAVQAARERAAMAQAGGAPLSQINAATEGRARGVQIGNDAIARATPESRSPIAGLSPLAGSAAEMSAGADRARSQRAQETAQYHDGIKKWSQGLKADANGNGIPDRDEAVAGNFGKFGINTIGQLDSMNSKYSIYKQAYNQDTSAQKSSRPMTFDEFAKNEYENFRKRPVFEDARSVVLEARKNQALADAEKRAPRVEQARQQGLMSAARAQALAQGYNPAQANQLGLQALQQDISIRESQKLRDDQASVLSMQDRGLTDRANIQGNAIKYGAEQQAGAARDASASGIRQAEIQAEAALTRQKESSAAQMEQIKMKLADPAQRMQTIGQVMSLHPDRAGLAARTQAEQQFVQAYPNAPISQVQAAGERAARSAIAAAVPMWNAIVADPQMQTVLPGGQSPLKAYTVPEPSAATQSPTAGAIPGGEWTAPKPAGELPVMSVIRKLEQFNGGQRPTREQIEEQLLSEGYAIDPTSPISSFINRQIDEYLKTGDKSFATPITNPPMFDTTGAIN